jgi:hypothetical protein
MKRKVIKLTLTLRDGVEVFTAEGDNRLSTDGLAVSCNIAFGNGSITPTAQIVIHGLALSKMLKLMRVQWNTMQSLLNTVRIEVGEQGSPLIVAYEGNITQATIDANAAPDVPLVITSQMAVYENMKVAEPYITPKDQDIDVADIISELCQKMGYEYENNGVSKIVVNYTLEGSDLDKIKQLCIECDIDLYVENKLIAICPKGGARLIKIPVISPSSGLIGYPVPDIKGVSFSCLYDPSIRFGGIITIKDSIIDVCNADWRLYGYTAQLEANIPNGKWQINANATWRDSKDAAVQR